jgi:hypothetical protein
MDCKAHGCYDVLVRYTGNKVYRYIKYQSELSK